MSNVKMAEFCYRSSVGWFEFFFEIFSTKNTGRAQKYCANLMEKTLCYRFTQFFYGDDIERMLNFFDKIFSIFTQLSIWAQRQRDFYFFFLVLLLTRFVCEELFRRVKNVHATLGDLPMKQW